MCWHEADGYAMVMYEILTKHAGSVRVEKFRAGQGLLERKSITGVSVISH